MQERIVVGVDGGGTRTRVAVVREDGRVLGIGASGSGNYHDVGIARFQAHVEEALKQAWSAAAQPARRAGAAFLGLASVVSERDREAIRTVCREMDLSPSVDVDHDLRIALAGGLSGRAGIAIIAGTGSSCYGRTPDGREWRSGGWGSLLDDLGSSHFLGVQAMIAAIRDFDGRGPGTVLRPRVMEALGIRDMNEILSRVDAQGMTRSERASLAPIVTRAAEEGDAVARSIIEKGADELALMAATVEKRLQFDLPVVTVTGGLVSAGPVFLGPLAAALARRAPACRLVESELPPVLGAALLAIESLGGGRRPAAENLKRTNPR